MIEAITRHSISPVSVVIPCYRCSATIERAVYSVAKQTYRPAEVILVDDASGDSTLDVLDMLKQRHGDWIKLIKLLTNQGAASARNVGWDAATQPYIAFLDADDAWHARKIEIQYQFLRDNPNVALCGHAYRELNEYIEERLNWNVDQYYAKSVTWLSLLFKNRFVTPSIMLKRDIPNRFFEGKRYVDDHLLWLEMVGEGMLAVKLDAELVAIYKAMYGASGLSSHLWEMEKSELWNYRYLYKKNNLNLFLYCLLICFSLAKFLKRMFVVKIYRKLAAII